MRTAALLRREHLDVSSAAVIEAVRLAETLAVLRRRPLAGLAELMEATEAVLCAGSQVPFQLVARRMLVGDALGRVPAETPMVPLARDLAAAQKRLRLKPSAAAQTLELDLRTGSHLERSKLFHRLLLLDVPWGRPAGIGRTRGTFKEVWAVEWQPELDVALIEASGAGTTIEAAASATVARHTEGAEIGGSACWWSERCSPTCPRGWPPCWPPSTSGPPAQHDTTVLMAAVEPLARVRRYGNVRRGDTEVVQRVLAGLVTRVAVGLPAACASLDDDAAADLRERVEGVSAGDRYAR